MPSVITVSDLRQERGETLEEFGRAIGVNSKGRVSEYVRENRFPLNAALALQDISGGRIDAAELCDDVRRARAGVADLRSHISEDSGDGIGLSAGNIEENSPGASAAA